LQSDIIAPACLSGVFGHLVKRTNALTLSFNVSLSLPTN
jgi:hypothetical protein